ncbi:transcriptional regulator, TetR family [Luteibacter sp. UNC138MFCol5.1]|uniref:TetR family transcriptional regulator n=1 Tax=Luteibacter sp. UNC138MFCol5.1 TaxID=1502774 RepID=UPI0008CBB10D|nr:TetR family transcriptional regulator [Luteibacter sp. UNC138MFCol5.1]SEO90354.1 transcriptional regulator, TetR family [Luteibacter sp. UNC138MFCol5.1]
MRNAEATKERILDAAMTEFSAYGIAGARVDRVAAEAGCNKNLIYIYFGNKESLFTAVLGHYLVPAYEHLAFTPDDVAGYAGRVFDFSMANPKLMRLLAWHSLEQSTEAPSERGASHAAKIRALSDARKAGAIGGAFPPEFLLTVIMTVATAWTAANAFSMSTGTEAARHQAQLRKRVTAAVRLLAAAETM